jgi:hypothetical protein
MHWCVDVPTAVRRQACRAQRVPSQPVWGISFRLRLRWGEEEEVEDFPPTDKIQKSTKLICGRFTSGGEMMLSGGNPINNLTTSTNASTNQVRINGSLASGSSGGHNFPLTAMGTLARRIY